MLAELLKGIEVSIKRKGVVIIDLPDPFNVLASTVFLLPIIRVAGKLLPSIYKGEYKNTTYRVQSTSEATLMSTAFHIGTLHTVDSITNLAVQAAQEAFKDYALKHDIV